MTSGLPITSAKLDIVADFLALDSNWTAFPGILGSIIGSILETSLAEAFGHANDERYSDKEI